MVNKRTSVYLSEELIDQAKDLRINLSKTLELALRHRILEEKQGIKGGVLEENAKVELCENHTEPFAGVAKSGQRRSVEGAVPQGFRGSNPRPRTIFKLYSGMGLILVCFGL